MKPHTRNVLIVFALTALLLSACGAGASPSDGGGKIIAVPAAYVGIVESLSGNQWTVSGQSITVDPAVVQGGPFSVGNPVRIEGGLDAGGSFKVTRLSTPSAQDLTSLPKFGSDDNSNGNANDNANANANGNGNDNANGNVNDNANVNGNVNDNANANGNVNDNVNANGNANDNVNANGNANDNVNAQRECKRQCQRQRQ